MANIENKFEERAAEGGNNQNEMGGGQQRFEKGEREGGRGQ